MPSRPSHVTRHDAFIGHVRQRHDVIGKTVKGKVLPYSLPSVGPGADPCVQAVSPQVT